MYPGRALERPQKLKYQKWVSAAVHRKGKALPPVVASGALDAFRAGQMANEIGPIPGMVCHHGLENGTICLPAEFRSAGARILGRKPAIERGDAV
jgi:hypothetical protein